MARIYQYESSFFGPPTITEMDDEDSTTDIQTQEKKFKELVKKGYNRVQEN